ncbi:MAG: DUF5655 domain-containing protein [Chloroflexota bacterium]|nr:DUF5655 domain-containing protein [Chloroflexota bacterium]
MSETRSWQEMYASIGDLLVRRTGEGVDAWNARIREHGFADEQSLRAWLTDQGVTGYTQSLLVMERFGYPDWALAPPDRLIEGQYADRAHLRPILDAVLARATDLGPLGVQARKGYVTLLTPRRTFASIEPTTKSRVDVGLRLPDARPTGRLEPARSIGQSSMTVRIGLSSVDEVDDEVADWLRKAYEANS